MRAASAAMIKNDGSSRIQQQEPRIGTKLRSIYDALTAHPGVPICLREFYPDLTKLKMAVEQLQNFYDLDIRSWSALTHNRKGAPAGTYILVGEYVKSHYVDYVAAKAD